MPDPISQDAKNSTGTIRFTRPLRFGRAYDSANTRPTMVLSALALLIHPPARLFPSNIAQFMPEDNEDHLVSLVAHEPIFARKAEGTLAYDGHGSQIRREDYENHSLAKSSTLVDNHAEQSQHLNLYHVCRQRSSKITGRMIMLPLDALWVFRRMMAHKSERPRRRLLAKKRGCVAGSNARKALLRFQDYNPFGDLETISIISWTGRLSISVSSFGSTVLMCY
ncbi:hypothetical protein QBC37DRAFT_379186 [Rhypophila decipiens]|uniref:Uncharacterized protein n=1 Tax=Rhypophila decipiens TaxID=261697 RepID=A0AAN7B4Z1_9PEZI|nr:hypothetical protein QBC37DRAFT_379186 [Rhypophila decipiens]